MPPPHRLVRASLLTLALAVLPLPRMTNTRAAASRSDSKVGMVRTIHRGLDLRQPQGTWHRSRVRAPLAGRDGLRTNRADRASLGFVDGTVLHMNQLTDITLVDGHHTLVQHGEIDQAVVPGTSHQVVTAAATTSAIGTNVDVRLQGTKTVVVVVEGAAVVRGLRGSVMVKTNQETTVQPGEKPTRPRHVDALKVVTWTRGLASSDGGENVALDANGGQVVAVSSTRGGTSSLWQAKFINDGRLDYGWESGSSDVSNASITLRLGDGRPYLISKVVIDPSATHGASPDTDLQDFEISVSDTTTEPVAFETVDVDSCQQANSLQSFDFSPVEAKYLKLTVDSTSASLDHVSIAELEVIGMRITQSPGSWSTFPGSDQLSSPNGLALDTAGNVYVADSGTNDVVDKFSPDGQLLTQFPSPGSSVQLSDPHGVATDANGNVYVTDNQAGSLDKFSPTGQYLGDLGGGALQSPTGVALDQQGNIYVVESSASRLQKLSPTGQPLAQWSTAGTYPEGVAVDRAGNVYVTLWDVDAIEEFSPSGQQLRLIGQGQLNEPAGLTLDAAGNLWVTEQGNNRVLKISPAGKILDQWGGILGSGTGELNDPVGIAVDGHGRALVADSGNQRVEILTPP